MTAPAKRGLQARVASAAGTSKVSEGRGNPAISVLSAEEKERVLKKPGRSAHPICGIIVGSSWHSPVACAYQPDHGGPHSWASIPQFEEALYETPEKWSFETLLTIAERLLAHEYPPDVFIGESGDAGPRFIVRLREAVEECREALTRGAAGQAAPAKGDSDG